MTLPNFTLHKSTSNDPHVTSDTQHKLPVVELPGGEP